LSGHPRPVRGVVEKPQIWVTNLGALKCRLRTELHLNSSTGHV
jgi:hypothetical protein